jgi:hypothetical protein
MHITPVQCVIKAFGGVRKTARAIGRTPGAISLWKHRDWIPSEISALVLKKARESGLDLTAEDVVLGREVP